MLVLEDFDLDNAVKQQLKEIYDKLLGAEFYLEMPLARGDQREQAEQHVIRYLNKLAILADQNVELTSLAYYIQEAIDTFDLEYIFNELENLLN